ncbi:oxidoreductase [Aestuarium zhoushanense]|nr:oxidoreductase [Aestuarium zhoushanense]
MKSVKWGILGAAKFAREHMARAIHAAEGAEFYALATSSAEKAADFQAFNPNLVIHDSYDALLADPEVEAVYIPLPNHLHVEWTLKALAAGKHVLCEKPMAMKEADFDAIIAARDASGLLAAEAYMIVHHPQFTRAKELLASGVIGDLMLVDTVFSFNNAEDTNNIRNKPETGGGALGDIGVYAFGSARFVTGEEPVSIRKAHIVRENGVDVFTQVMAEFPSFAYQGTVSMRMANRQHLTFHGTEGHITLTAPFNAGVYDIAELILEAPATERHVERWPTVNQYVLQVENFGKTIRTGAAYPCPLEFSRGTQAMTDMVLAAE